MNINENKDAACDCGHTRDQHDESGHHCDECDCSGFDPNLIDRRHISESSDHIVGGSPIDRSDMIDRRRISESSDHIVGRGPASSSPRTCKQHEGNHTRKGDFMVIEGSSRPERDSMYRRISVAGCTYDRDGLLQMATGMKQLREPDAEVTDIEEAISVVEGGGWTVLEFRN